MTAPSLPPFLEADAHADPLLQFRRWFDEALAAGLPDANAMTLSTVSTDARPSARIVLLKTADARGFVFYTNYNSRKGRELSAQPIAALTFFWPTLQRQIRIEGTISRVGGAESDAYFRTRPRESQIGAWVSQQSEVATSRAAIDQYFEEVSSRYQGTEIPRPPHWGGFLVTPTSVEFWQARPGRLHDRLRYRPRALVGNDAASWTLERLWP